MMYPRYFSLQELTATSTGIANVPDWVSLRNLIDLGLFLDSVREEFGRPIRVNCAYRSAAVNSRVGGVAGSAHLVGLAADICAWSGKEADNRALLAVLEKRILEIDQLISYHVSSGDQKTKVRFIHVGLAKNGARRQRLYK